MRVRDGGMRLKNTSAAVRTNTDPISQTVAEKPIAQRGEEADAVMPLVNRQVLLWMDVAIVMHHLRDAEVSSQQLRAVPRGSGGDRVTREGRCRRLQPQGLG